MYTSKYRIRGLMAVAAMLMLMATSCIKNDIPFPRIQANIAWIEVEHTLQAASIDSASRTIRVFLDEAADIRNVKMTGAVLSPAGAHWPDSASFAAGVDLSSPRKTVVSLYQDYTWTISADQPMTRWFTVEGQVGASTIDPIGCRVVVDVPDHTNLTRIKVLTMKLGGPEAVYSPGLEGSVTDFSAPVNVDVTEHGRTTTWSIYVQTTESTVTMESVDAWTCVAWLHASAMAERDNHFEYRMATATEWTRVPDEWVTADGGSLTARVIHLQPLTDYVARCVSDDEVSAEIDFTTGSTYSIPNGTMDDWWKDGKVWCPWIEGGESYWDTGNKGASTLGQSNSEPTTDTPSGTGQAARLETRFVGIGAIGKLAAGNLFSGVYVKTDGTNGILDFGRPFTLHPTRFRGMFKYHSAEISHSSAGFEYLKGRPDTCAIWCALIDTDLPFQIRTNPANRNLFDPDGDYVVAYGTMNLGYDVDNYIPFDIPLVYKSTSRTPRYLIMVASASKYGDFFTGGNGSVLYVDDFSLEFDYDN